MIPNPFGPFESGRFTTQVATEWLSGKSATCTRPDYIRDNIHVTLLARAYCQFIETLPCDGGAYLYRPTGYVESVGDFFRRFSNELSPHLNRPCTLKFTPQTIFDEPLKITNSDTLDPMALKWNESLAWKELADYYQQYSVTHTLKEQR